MFLPFETLVREGGGGGEGIESVGCPAINILHGTNTVLQKCNTTIPSNNVTNNP